MPQMYSLIFLLLATTAQTGHLYAVVEDGMWQECIYVLNDEEWSIEIPIEEICPTTLNLKG